MKPDAWKFRVCVPLPTRDELVHEGECETYEACRTAIALLGVEMRPRVQQGGTITGFYSGNRQVFLQFERLSDGYTMNEWGTNWDGSVKQFPAG